MGINTDPTSSLHVVGNAYISTTLTIGGDFTAPNIYNKSEVNSLFSSFNPTIADGSLTVSKINGLSDVLLNKASKDDLNNTNISLGYVSQSLINVQTEIENKASVSSVSDLTILVNTKASQSSLNVANSNISALGDNVNNGYTTLSQSLALKSSQASLDFTNNTVANKQDKLGSSSNININTLTCGKTVINEPTSSSSRFITCEVGSSLSYFQFSHGHHIDTYTRNDDAGRTLYINYYSNAGLRIGNSNGKIGINCDPDSFPFERKGSGKFSGSLSCNNLVQTSDQRLKENVQNISLDECVRIIKTVHPKTYNRIDMEGKPPRIGYIAQHLDNELKDNFRCIMGADQDEHGPLLGLDYSRMVVILHGALLNALNRIEILESKQ